MSASFPVFADDQLSPEEKLLRLQAINTELAESLHRLSVFQQKVLTIKKCSTVDEALDQMEQLLDEATEFIYARLYLRDDEGAMVKEREMCPEDLALDWSLVEWACENQELAIIPLEETADLEGVHSLLLLPLAGHAGALGILVLWLETDPTVFTQEQSALLTMLARETAGVIETHRFRERIERARAELEDVVESVPHGLMRIDAGGTINLINGTMEFMLDVRRGDVVGNPYDSALPRPVADLLVRMLKDQSGEEQELKIDLRGVGEILGVTATPMHGGPENELLGYVIICRDLAMSREILKLRELDALKNDFLSLVSHELRTPLTSIMAYSETLLMEGMVDTEEERREYLQIINSEGARLNRLINDVLDLTKMEAGKMEYCFEEHDLNDIVHTAIGSSSSLAMQKSLELTTELCEDLPPAKVDSDRIMQVLMNFLSNAIKFTPEGGRVTVHTASTPPEEGKSVPTITAWVEDTGCGIAPENLNRVFSKFEQIENIDHHHVGTGLGMPICKQIIEDGHGGTIWIESEVGKGTRVYFRIPVS